MTRKHVLKWELVQPEDLKERCDIRRGERRSKVLCERDLGHTGFHAGRGRIGQWFIWGNHHGVSSPLGRGRVRP